MARRWNPPTSPWLTRLDRSLSRVADRCRPFNMPREDALQEARLAVLRAVREKKYLDAENPEAYLVTVAQRALTEQWGDGVVRVPARTLRDIQKGIVTERGQIDARRARAVVKSLGLKFKAKNHDPLFPLDEDDEDELGVDAPDYDARILCEQLLDRSGLTKHERDIVARHCGLEGQDGATFAEIARQDGLHRATPHLVFTAAVRKMRALACA